MESKETKHVDGRFLKISYTGRIKDGSVFDTTDSEVAKKEHIFEAKRVYKPLPVVLNHGQVIVGLEEAIKDMNAGEEKEVEIVPSKAYGERSEDLIRLIPISAFKKQKIQPYPGMRFDVEGRTAKVQTVSGGRVRVDFNPDLAGKTLVYKVKIEGEAKKIEEKVEFLVERSFNTADDFTVKISGNNIDIVLPESAFKDKNIHMRKAVLAGELYHFTTLENITYLETWKKPKAKEEKGVEETKA